MHGKAKENTENCRYDKKLHLHYKMGLMVSIKFSDTKFWVLNIIKSEHSMQAISLFQIKKTRKQNILSQNSFIGQN